MGIDLLSVFLVGLGLSMDAFAVSVSNGMALCKVEPKHSVKVGLFFGFAQGIMPVIGYFIGKTFSSYVQVAAPWIALVLLGFIGGKMIHEALKNEEECSLKDPMCTGTLCLLSVATSIDALAVGVVLAVSGGEVYLSATIIAVITFFISATGVYIGKGIGKLLKNKAEIFGGIVLILIGIKMVLEHYGLLVLWNN